MNIGVTCPLEILVMQTARPFSPDRRGNPFFCGGESLSFGMFDEKNNYFWKLTNEVYKWRKKRLQQRAGPIF